MEIKNKLWLLSIIINCINTYCIDIRHHIEIIKVENLGYYATVSINNKNIACIYANDTEDYFTTKLDCQIAAVKWFIINILEQNAIED